MWPSASLKVESARWRYGQTTRRTSNALLVANATPAIPLTTVDMLIATIGLAFCSLLVRKQGPGYLRHGCPHSRGACGNVFGNSPKLSIRRHGATVTEYGVSVSSLCN
jgi:hypothetical protein